MANPHQELTKPYVLDGWVYQISIQQIFGAEAAPCFDDVRGREGKWGSLCVYDSWVPGCCYELFRH